MAITDSGLGVSWGAGQSFYDYIMNDLFRPLIAEVIINPNTLSRRITRSSGRVRGRKIVFPVHYGRNNGVSAIGPSGQMPEAGSQRHLQYSFDVRHVYGRIKIDGLSLDASEGSVASWAEALTLEMRGLMVDFERKIQRMRHGDGSGYLVLMNGQTGAAQTSFGGGGANGTLLFPTFLVEASATSCPDQNRLMWLEVGDRIALVELSGGGGTAGNVIGTSTIATITDSTGTGATFTTSSAITTTTGRNYAIVLMATDDATGTSAAANGGYLNEPMGIGGIIHNVDTPGGPFQGISTSSSSNTWHQANIVYGNGSAGAAAVALTTDHFDEAYAASVEKAGVAPTIIMGSFLGVRNYAKLVRTDRRYVNTMNFDAGVAGLEFNMTPVIADRDHRKNVFSFIHEPDLQVEVMKEPGWLNRDGLTMRMASNDTDSIWAAFYCRETVSSMARHCHTILTQVKVPV